MKKVQPHTLCGLETEEIRTGIKGENIKVLNSENIKSLKGERNAFNVGSKIAAKTGGWTRYYDGEIISVENIVSNRHDDSVEEREGSTCSTRHHFITQANFAGGKASIV